MRVDKTYKDYLKCYNGNKELALRETICETSRRIRSSKIDDEFMREYYEATRYLMIVKNISPSLLLGLFTGVLVSVLGDISLPWENVLSFAFWLEFVMTLFEKVSVLLLGITIIYFAMVFFCGTRSKCVLCPHLVEEMNNRLRDSHKQQAERKEKAKCVRRMKVHIRRRK